MRFFLIVIFLANCSYYSLGQCYQSGQNLPNTGYLLVSSGYSGLDAVVYSEIPKLEAFFGVKVDFFFLLESYSENAMYIHSCNYNCDGTIALGIKLLYAEFLNDPSLTTVKAALAHEFAHCIQKLQGWDERGKRRELHSDFLAGYYLRKTHSYANYDAFNKAIYSFYNKGDFDFWNPGHHGTPEERSCALMCGWNLGGEPQNYSILQASNKALEYVFADNPCGELPSLPQNVERRIIGQTQSNNNFNNRPWKYDVRHVNNSFSKMISIGFSPSKISGVPWSIYYEPATLYSKKKYRYNLQYRNKQVDSFNEIGLKTKYLSIGTDSKHYFSHNTVNSCDVDPPVPCDVDPPQKN